MAKRAMQAIRLLVESAFGVATTAAVFVGLTGLIAGGETAPFEARLARKIQFTPLFLETREQPRRPDKPPKPRVFEIPPIPGPSPEPRDGARVRIAPVVLVSPPIRGGGRSLGIAPRALETDLTPVFRIPPEYPPNGRGNGSVLVRFDVTRLGTVANARVVESTPPGMFERAALRAIERWRYRPAVVDGEPVERRGLQVRLRFALETT
jgi:protein TonB